MTIEDRMASMDDTLKQILTALLSGATATALLGEPEKKAVAAAASAKGKDKAAVQGALDKAKGEGKPTSDGAGAVLEGDEPGTQYWMSHDGADFYKSKPNEGKPPVDNINNVSAAYWREKREASNAAKNAQAAAAVKLAQDSAAAGQAANAGTEPSATAQPDTASAIPFKTVVDRLTELSKDKTAGRGREGVMIILNDYLAHLPVAERKVPKLEALNQNAAILATIAAAMGETAAAPAADLDDPFA